MTDVDRMRELLRVYNSLDIPPFRDRVAREIMAIPFPGEGHESGVRET